MQSLINPTLPLESKLSASNVFFITSLEPSRQGGTNFLSNEPPPSPHIASFNWDRQAELCLPSDAPFQIKVKVGQYIISRCIFYEGSSVSILSAHA